jgi:hypothetical protein
MDPRSNFRRWDAPSSGSTKLAAKTKAYSLDAVSFPFELKLGGVEAMLRGSITERAALSHGSHAIWTAWAQNASGLAVSRNRPNASKDGIACRLIESCSASSLCERR